MDLPRTSNSRRLDVNDELVIDGVLSTQPELGPSIPDGGYGWIIFIATLFFNIMIHSLPVSFGVYLCYAKIYLTVDDKRPYLWDDTFVYVPLFFAFSWTLIEPLSRSLVQNSTWPRLVATAATCVTCAGLLFVWIASTGRKETWLFILGGFLAGAGASLQLAQCEILVAQYFRLKLTLLVHITNSIVVIGYILTPIILRDHLLDMSLGRVILWYQTILLQGLIVSLCFKKPLYLKSKKTHYNYLQANPDDEEDIYSKDAKELQSKQENEAATDSSKTDAIPSTSGRVNTNEGYMQNWEKFDDDNDDDEEEVKYDPLRNPFATDNHSDKEADQKPKSNWKTFKNEENKGQHNTVNLHDELHYANANSNMYSSNVPVPLFSDLPLNNNITYAFDDGGANEHPVSNVFSPNVKANQSFFSKMHLELLKQPTFYKSLLMITTTKFSQFAFYTMFPSYMYQELNMHFRTCIGVLSFISVCPLVFSFFTYWINIDKQRRPLCLCVLCWLGAFGYILITESVNKYTFEAAAACVALSIAALNFVGKPLMGLTQRGEQSKELFLISLLAGSAFLIFLVFDIRLRVFFRFMALLHFANGSIWLSNFVFKKIKLILF